MMLKMLNGLMLMMMLVDRDVRDVGLSGCLKRVKMLWKKQTMMQEVPDEMLVTRDALGEDEDDERRDADGDAS